MSTFALAQAPPAVGLWYRPRVREYPGISPKFLSQYLASGRLVEDLSRLQKCRDSSSPMLTLEVAVRATKIAIHLAEKQVLPYLHECTVFVDASAISLHHDYIDPVLVHSS